MLNDFDNFIYKHVLDKNFIENSLGKVFEISLITCLRKIGFKLFFEISLNGLSVCDKCHLLKKFA